MLTDVMVFVKPVPPAPDCAVPLDAPFPPVAPAQPPPPASILFPAL